MPTNHSNIIAVYEVACEYAWLHRVINHIQLSCGIEPIGSSIIIYEDNVAWDAQMQIGYVKSNAAKHITHKLFYPHKIQVNGEISIMQIKSSNNLADLFIKSISYFIFSKCVTNIVMRRLRYLHDLGKRFIIKPSVI
jgi:hypothetical protein